MFFSIVMAVFENTVSVAHHSKIRRGHSGGDSVYFYFDSYYFKIFTCHVESTPCANLEQFLLLVLVVFSVLLTNAASRVARNCVSGCDRVRCKAGEKNIMLQGLWNGVDTVGRKRTNKHDDNKPLFVSSHTVCECVMCCTINGLQHIV